MLAQVHPYMDFPGLGRLGLPLCIPWGTWNKVAPGLFPLCRTFW